MTAISARPFDADEFGPRLATRALADEAIRRFRLAGWEVGETVQRGSGFAVKTPPFTWWTTMPVYDVWDREELVMYGDLPLPDHPRPNVAPPPRRLKLAR